RAHPPFPTRRSSDLPGRLTGGAEVNLARGTHVARLRVDDWPLHPVTDASGAVVAPIAAVLDVDVDTHGPWRRPSGTLALDATSVDRKSTRLNSSHVK